MKFDKLELPIELKPRQCNNPFVDPPEGSDVAEYQFQSDNGIQNRGQLVAVLTELTARQFRTHAFLVYLDSQDVRFIRSDRCGLAVTEAINYRLNSKFLAEFFLRFNEMTDAEREAGMLQYELLRDILKNWPWRSYRLIVSRRKHGRRN